MSQGFPRKAVVVGAGLSGLSTAMHLLGAGVEVTVIDRSRDVGGLCHTMMVNGISHDSGPTVLTMPDLLRDTFGALGSDLDSELKLTRLDPAYRAVFADGSHIDVGDSVDKTAASIESVCGAAEAERFTKFAAHCERLWRIMREPFMQTNTTTPLSLLGRPLLALIRAGGFRSLQSAVDSAFADERTRRLMSFQSLYAGVAPEQARALYNVITYMDVIAGVFAPIGGMAAIPAAMAAAIRRSGGTIRTGVAARQVTTRSGRVTGVLTDEELISTDAVVLTCDPTEARALVGLAPVQRRLRRSPSCIVVHAQVPKGFAGIAAHHTIHFGSAWRETFREIIHDGSLMTDPSILLSAPAITEPGLGTHTSQPVYLLLPAPHHERTQLHQSRVRAHVDDALQVLNRRGVPLERQHIIDEVTPADWAKRGMPAGTPFSLAHTLTQTGPFRPRNYFPAIDGVALAGAGTVPGVGIPTVLMSGRLAAERLVGPR